MCGYVSGGSCFLLLCPYMFVIIIWKLKYIWGICYNYMEIEVYMGNLLRQL